MCVFAVQGCSLCRHANLAHAASLQTLHFCGRYTLCSYLRTWSHGTALLRARLRTRTRAVHLTHEQPAPTRTSPCTSPCAFPCASPCAFPCALPCAYSCASPCAYSCASPCTYPCAPACALPRALSRALPRALSRACPCTSACACPCACCCAPSCALSRCKLPLTCGTVPNSTAPYAAPSHAASCSASNRAVPGRLPA